MNSQQQETPGLDDDPILGLLLRGEAATLDEAEERYLNESGPELLELLRSGRSESELTEDPLIRLLVSRGSRAWEDSML